jgi:hypothetical protein
MTALAIKIPLNRRVASSGKGNPTPPRIRRRKIPK